MCFCRILVNMFESKYFHICPVRVLQVLSRSVSRREVWMCCFKWRVMTALWRCYNNGVLYEARNSLTADPAFLFKVILPEEVLFYTHTYIHTNTETQPQSSLSPHIQSSPVGSGTPARPLCFIPNYTMDFQFYCWLQRVSLRT